MVVKGNVKQIACSAFAGSRIKAFEVQGNVGTIGKGAFRYSYLEKFLCHGSVKRIEEEAFYEAQHLQKASFGKKLKYIGKHAFEGCSKIKAPRVKKGSK